MKTRVMALSIVTFLLATATLRAQDQSGSSEQPADTAATDASATDASAPVDSDAAAVPPDSGGEAAASSSGSAPTDDAPTGTGAGAPGGGLMNFQTDLFTGRFNYRVPIVVPPARGNSQPSIALGYSAGAGNGWCGVGWMLDMGYIQRDTRRGVPIGWNGAVPQNCYDASKGFVFNLGGAESRLVRIGPSGSDTEYRAETDNGAFLKFLLKSDGSWQATDKTGNTFYFGTSNSSRMTNSKFTASAVISNTFRWALDRAEDANGNKTTVTYITNSNQLYLSQIKYNQSTKATFPGNTVDFQTSGSRPDATVSFAAGYRVETRLLLTGIVVKADGQNVRKYSLSYTNSPGTYRSLITQVLEYGTNFASGGSALPALKFTYQTNSFSFGPLTDWGTVTGQGTNIADWQSIRAQNGSLETTVDFMDMDRDGLPDRVMRSRTAPYDRFKCQRNTRTGFVPTDSTYDWSPLESQGDTGAPWNSPRTMNGVRTTTCDMIDINGDGYPDRVMREKNSPYSVFVVQTNTGYSFSSAFNWGGVTNEATTEKDEWRGVRDGQANGTRVDMIDLNADGLPDRVMRKPSSPFTYFKVQLNTSSNFTGMLTWTNLYTEGDTTNSDWNNIYGNSNDYDTKVGLYDINGDGLPDRVNRKHNSPYSYFGVQFNNGTGFENWEQWGGTIDGQGQPQSSDGWYSPVGSDGAENFASLADINGDGLMDRVMRSVSGSPITTWKVQLNTGTGFSNLVTWTGVSADDNGQNWRSVTTTRSSGNSTVEFVDINGDGLPDRVMRKITITGADFFSNWRVQLNSGPFPDLMSSIDNSMGGTVKISYAPSTQYDNRERPMPTSDPWTDGVRSLLAQPIWTVSQVVVDDGVDHTGAAALVNSYTYAQGMYDYVAKEFRGFNKVTATDPAGGKTITYFHQGGGTNGTAMGEFNDAGSKAKKGMPYRVEVYGALPNTNLFTRTLNKVDEVQISNGWTFAFVGTNIVQTFEGLGNSSLYKATCKTYSYDVRPNDLTSTGDLLKESNWGEVIGVNESSLAFTPTGDDVHTLTHYLGFANGARKPDWIHTTSDFAGNTVLRETKFTYDTVGNMLTHLRWLGGSSYATNSVAYDTYGNPTNSTDAAGISTATTYDTTYQMFPLRTITGTFTNKTAFDFRSGSILSTTNAAGLAGANTYDEFFRLKQTDISTNAFGPTVLWRTKTSYNLGDARTYSLYVHRQVFDTSANGIESRTYMDGFGRSIQTRAEAEGTAGAVRVVNTFYDVRGKVDFQTLPCLQTSGWSYDSNACTQCGSFTGFDPIGRPNVTVSPATMAGVPCSDTCSPVGSNTVAYIEGTTFWRTVTTDPLGNVRKADNDAYGRIKTIVEPSPGGTTSFFYDKVGNLGSLSDSAGNVTTMRYDQLGAKTNMVDADMGTWSYKYDAARRMTEQTDGKGQKIKFFYNDELGRLTKKELYNSAGSFVTNITYVYDTNQGQGAWQVYKGQLFMVSDRQGWQRHSYDVRGRVLKSSRYLTVNTTQYDSLSVYDEADRVVTNTYPGNTTKLAYTYDSVSHLVSVASTCGTGANETFYKLGGLDELGRVTSYTNGTGTNAVINVYNYFTNSRRLQGILATSAGGTSLQNLSYCYDKVGNVGSITDGTYSGTASASLDSIHYDGLYRLKDYTRFGNGSTFTYNSIGNVLTSSEGPSGTYSYGTKPHAVTSIGGTKTYSYDTCGNMTNRNGWALSYDEENQLTQIVGTNTVTYGYADGGQRLWKSVGGQLTIYIGGVYEYRASGNKTLCHIFAGGMRIATFEPSGVFCSWLYRHPSLATSYEFLAACVNWPLQDGRTPLTAALIPLLGVLCVSVLSRRRLSTREWTRMRANQNGVIPSLSRNLCLSLRLFGGTGVPACVACEFGSALQRRYARLPLRPYSFGLQAVSVLLVVALFLAVTPTEVEAATCSPVFWYYHGDHLGSASILTDRSGALANHYEYYAFGKDRYNSGTCSFNVANRYTGQVLDEDTGLYYYNARYYDPEIGRFIQADTIVPTAVNPQTLNRYSYCANNPLNCTDPSGHDFGISALIIAIVISVAVNVAIAAAQGGNIGLAVATGVVSGALGFAGAFVGSQILGTIMDKVLAAAIGGAIGGAAGGAASAAISGGNVGLGALSGGIGGAIGGAAGQWTAGWGDSWKDLAGRATVSVLTGSMGGGIAAAIGGDNVWQGMAWGAAGAAIGFAASVALSGAAPKKAAEVKEDHPQGTANVPELGGQPSGQESGSAGEQTGSTEAKGVDTPANAPGTPKSTLSQIAPITGDPSLNNTGGVTTAGSPPALQTDAKNVPFWQWLKTRNWTQIWKGTALIIGGNEIRGIGASLVLTGTIGGAFPGFQLPATAAISLGVSGVLMGSGMIAYGSGLIINGFVNPPTAPSPRGQ